MTTKEFTSILVDVALFIFLLVASYFLWQAAGDFNVQIGS
jgi:nitrogen fixation-related uncharacterized protein